MAAVLPVDEEVDDDDDGGAWCGDDDDEDEDDDDDPEVCPPAWVSGESFPSAGARARARCCAAPLEDFEPAPS